MYALAHDLVEVYAGDTYIYDNNRKFSKEKREKEAIIKIRKRFANFKNLIKVIEKYERKEDEESKFIYALDKIIPPLQIYLEDGKLWHEKKVSLVDVFKNKNKKIALSVPLKVYWDELSRLLIRNKKKLFPKL